ncbi:MAG: hypothetical protein ACFFE4_20760 [Candidatus Thorarchaeota archaeon]
MNFKGIRLLSTELSGFWIQRSNADYINSLFRIYYLSTSLSLIIIFYEVIRHLTLVPVAAFLISGVAIIFLDFYSPRRFSIIFPSTSIILILLAGYVQFYLLFIQNSTRSSPSISLFPDLIQIILGIIFSLRILIGLRINKSMKHYQKSYIPYSKNQKALLETFESNLELLSNQIAKEFDLEVTTLHLRRIFKYWIISIGIVCILLIPLWLNIYFGILIYPYLLIIPGAVVALFSYIKMQSKYG